MAKRARPGDQKAIEQQLGAHADVFLAELLELTGVSSSGWQQVAALQATLETFAVVRLAARYREEGMGAGAALERAGRECDVSPDTIRTRLERWGRASREMRHDDTTPSTRA